jgi:hypothetical protein
VRCAAVALFALGLTSLAFPIAQFGEEPRYKITADQARSAASGFLIKLGLDPGQYQHVTYPEVHWERTDRMAAKYFLERRSLADASALFERYRPVHHWITRYFKPLDQEEFEVSVHPETAQPLGFNHEIPEDRTGADLPIDQARAIAERFAVSHGWDVSAMDLKESSSEKKKARRDSDFEWESRAGDPRNVDETRFRVAIEVSGDQVTSGHVYWKTPEAFDRAREASNAVSIGVAVARIVVTAGVLVYALWLIILGTRNGVIRWGAALKLAAPAVVLYPVGRLLLIGLRLKDYNTAKPIETFQVETYLDILTGTLGTALALILASAIIASFYPRALEELRRANRRILGLDAVFAVGAAAGFGLLIRHLSVALTAHFHAQALIDVNAPDTLASVAPSLSALSDAPASTIALGALSGLIVMLILQAHRRAILVPGALIAVSALVDSRAHNLGEFALEYGLGLSLAAAAIIFCWYFARRNYLAYALVFWLVSLAGPFAELRDTSRSLHAWIIVVVIVLSLLWSIAPALSRDP